MKKICVAFCLCLAVAVGFAALGSAADGKALYAKCQGCHGADGTKKAAGVGKPIKGMSAADVAAALKGYKAKTFGGERKAMMEGLSASLSDADIQALADYVSKL